jgi:hypothetical protein
VPHGKGRLAVGQERLQYWYYGREGFMEYTAEVVSDGVTYIVLFMTISIGIQILLRVLHQQSEGLQCWYYCLEGLRC